MLKLRKYNKKDLERHLELFLMNGVYKRINEKTEKQEGEWIERVIENYKKKNPDSYTLAIILDGKLIGNLIAEKIDYENKTLEIGFWIGKNYWNKGYATKALKKFLKKIEKKFPSFRIIARHKMKNVASGRVLKKSGFKFKKNEKGMKVYFR